MDASLTFTENLPEIVKWKFPLGMLALKYYFKFQLLLFDIEININGGLKHFREFRIQHSSPNNVWSFRCVYLPSSAKIELHHLEMARKKQSPYK